MTSNEDFRRRVDKDGIDFVSMQFTDIVGIVKSVTVPVRELDVVLKNGQWFDGSSVLGFARIAESDMYLVPDLDTYSVVPWTSNGSRVGRIICDVYTPKGRPFEGDPRFVLKQALQEAAAMGFRYNAGPEPEFFLFESDDDGRAVPRPQDQGSYFDFSTDRGGDVRNEMTMALASFGIEVEASHHEVASGQHEIDFRYTDALKAADNVVTFKATLKEVARRHRLHATFMPKPIGGINGSGMHVHQSLVHQDTGINAFADTSAEHGLSKLALSFIAGQLAHARGMAAVLAPLVNSYKRLVPGFEAPVYVSWGQTNRSALIRVPQIQPGRLESTRLELRCPDPSCNPYLAFAVMLRAGLDGIQRELEPPPISNQDLYEEPSESHLETLPGSLGQALQELQRDGLVCDTLGEHILDRFVEAKASEWRDYVSHVSNWELERYLPIY